MTLPYTHAVMVTGSRTWDSEENMRHAFNEIWHLWNPATVSAPVLLSGHCQSGADAMAERLWQQIGLPVLTFPADWNAHGKTAGFIRNRSMVDALVSMRQAGTVVHAAAFLDLCRSCDHNTAPQQLYPNALGHFSHGTVHAHQCARSAGVPVLNCIHPALPPF